MRCSVQWLTVFSTATNSPHPAPECGKEWAEQRYTAQRPAERDWELRAESRDWCVLGLAGWCGGCHWSEVVEEDGVNLRPGLGAEPGNTRSWAAGWQ